MIPAEEFKIRREALMAKIEDDSLVVLFSGRSKKRSADSTYDFETNRNFYYLTGIDQEDSILVLTKSNGLLSEYLFIQPYDELKEKWTGIRLRNTEVKKISGIENILYIDTFQAQLAMMLDPSNKAYGNFLELYLDLEIENKIDEQKTTLEFKEYIEKSFVNLKVNDIYKDIITLRMIKSQNEIKELKEAILVTNIGLKKILNNLKANIYEYQLAALFEYTIKDHDYSALSFPTICASGVNATILHYPNPISKIKENDLLLLDLGAQHNKYCADITRTYPVSGKFSDLQKKLYNIVLGANKLVIASVKPGVTIKELQELTINHLSEGLLKLGIIKEKEEISKYYFHNVSHHIGLDTHDPALREMPLESGMIISDEPGLYIKELGIGIRIEDDILVTDEGSFCLSGNIIKEVDDIEMAMGVFRK